jgi:hypothetical protein
VWLGRTRPHQLRRAGALLAAGEAEPPSQRDAEGETPSGCLPVLVL